MVALCAIAFTVPSIGDSHRIVGTSPARELTVGAEKPQTAIPSEVIAVPGGIPSRAASESVGRPSTRVRLPPGAVIAAPGGSVTGAGSLDSPVDLATALSHRSPVRSGGTVFLRGGVYHGAYVSALTGTQRQPIVVRSYPGEWAVIDGGTVRASTLDVEGSDTWIRDLEVMKSDPKRQSTQKGNSATDVSRGRWSGVWVNGPRTKLINLLIHDNGEGIGFWRPAVDAEVYGCITFNNGWLGADGGWGHGIYLQNENGTKRITDTIVFKNFGYGVHGWANYGPMQGMAVDGVTSFENGTPSNLHDDNMLFGAPSSVMDRISVRNSATYHGPRAHGYGLHLGWSNLPATVALANGTVDVEGNYIVGGSTTASFVQWQHMTVVRNTFVSRDNPNDRGVLAELFTSSGAGSVAAKTSDYKWDANEYYDAHSRDTSHGSFVLDNEHGQSGDASLDSNEWRNRSGFDGKSVFEPRTPGSVHVIIRPNRYERGRAHVTVFNWTGANRVPIDLAKAGLRRGQAFEIRDIQNVLGKPVVTGIYRGLPVSIPMNLSAISPPIGKLPFAVAHTSKEFGAFLVLPR